MRGGVAALGIALAACVLGAGVGNEAGVSDDTTRRQAGRCASAREVVEQAQRAAESAGADIGWGLSPLFPATWPPAGEPVALLFAYVRLPLPTSMERWEVQSPFLRVEVPLAEAAASPRLARLHPRPLTPSEAGRSQRATPEVMEQAAASLLHAICARSLPAPEDAKRVREAYRQWAFEHRALAVELRRHCPEFFAWLDTEG